MEGKNAASAKTRPDAVSLSDELSQSNEEQVPTKAVLPPDFARETTGATYILGDDEDDYIIRQDDDDDSLMGSVDGAGHVVVGKLDTSEHIILPPDLDRQTTGTIVIGDDEISYHHDDGSYYQQEEIKKDSELCGKERAVFPPDLERETTGATFVGDENDGDSYCYRQDQDGESSSGSERMYADTKIYMEHFPLHVSELRPRVSFYHNECQEECKYEEEAPHHQDRYVMELDHHQDQSASQQTPFKKEEDEVEALSHYTSETDSDAQARLEDLHFDDNSVASTVYTGDDSSPVLETAESFWVHSPFETPTPVEQQASGPHVGPHANSGESVEEQACSKPTLRDTNQEQEKKKAHTDKTQRDRIKIVSASILLVVVVAVVTFVVLFLVLGDSSSGQGSNSKVGSDVDVEGLIVSWRNALVEHGVSKHADFLVDSPQSSALYWLVYVDEFFPKVEGVATMDNLLQRYILLVLAYACGGEEWRRIGAPWTVLPTKHECDWGGLECEKSTVISLDLSAVIMLGTLPEEIGSLTNLVNLHVDNNRLEGSLPGRIYELSKLETLHIAFNRFSSSISDHISQLTNLESVWLESNSLSGALPAAIKNLVNLKHANFRYNQLSGPLLDIATEWTDLVHLDAGENRFSGMLPTTLHLLSHLAVLDLEGNDFIGTIPSELGMVSTLEIFRVGKNVNGISGTLPSEIGNIPNLTQLVASYANQLSGEIPTTLGSLEKLDLIDISGNSFSGSIPSELGNLAVNLRVVDLNVNKLVGSLPTELKLLTNLEEFYIQINFLTGTIPQEFCDNNVFIHYDCAVSCDCCGQLCHT